MQPIPFDQPDPSERIIKRRKRPCYGDKPKIRVNMCIDQDLHQRIVRRFGGFSQGVDEICSQHFYAEGMPSLEPFNPPDDTDDTQDDT